MLSKPCFLKLLLLILFFTKSFPHAQRFHRYLLIINIDIFRRGLVSICNNKDKIKN